MDGRQFGSHYSATDGRQFGLHYSAMDGQYIDQINNTC